MDGPARRAAILALLEGADGPVSASALARHCGVSRQIVVGDIALLRAGGVPVTAHRFVSWAFGTRREDAGIFSGRRTPPQRPRQGAAVPCFFAPPSAARPGPPLVLAFFC